MVIAPAAWFPSLHSRKIASHRPHPSREGLPRPGARRRRPRDLSPGQGRPVRVADVTGPRIAIGPRPWDGITAVGREAGGEAAGSGPDDVALVWLGGAGLD